MRRTKWNVLLLASALALTLLCAHAVAAPRHGEQNQPEQSAKKDQDQSVHVYRVTYKISELENGKTINARSYTLMARTRAVATAHVGSRVPMDLGGNKIQYQDIGVTVRCIVTNQEASVLVQTDVSMITLGGEEPVTSPGPPLPVERNLGLLDVTSVAMGKPVLVGSIDDVVSNHRYVIEVTVTKVM